MCSTVISATSSRSSVLRDSNADTCQPSPMVPSTAVVDKLAKESESESEMDYFVSTPSARDMTTTTTSIFYEEQDKDDTCSSLYLIHEEDENGVDEDFLNALAQIAASTSPLQSVELTSSFGVSAITAIKTTSKPSDADVDKNAQQDQNLHEDDCVSLHPYNDHESHLISPPSSPLTVPSNYGEDFDNDDEEDAAAAEAWMMEMDIDYDRPSTSMENEMEISSESLKNEGKCTNAAGTLQDVNCNQSPAVATPLIQAPTSLVDGMINAYLVVDPVSKIVIFPRQVLTCNVGTADNVRMESIEFGPFFLPNFDTNVIAEYTEHVVATYRQNHRNDDDCTMQEQQPLDSLEHGATCCVTPDCTSPTTST